MMGKIVEHFISGLQQDCEQLRQQRELGVLDSEVRRKKELKLYQQLSELLDTERKYVEDLEQVSQRVPCLHVTSCSQVCGDYAPLLRESAGHSTIDRKRTSKVKRKGSHIQTLIGDFKRTSDKGSSEDLLSCDSVQPSSRE